MRDKHCMTWNMERVKSVNYEKYTLQDLDMVRKLKKVENETQTLYDMKYGEKQ